LAIRIEPHESSTVKIEDTKMNSKMNEIEVA